MVSCFILPYKFQGVILVNIIWLFLFLDVTFLAATGQQEDFSEDIPSSRVLRILAHWANPGGFTAGTLSTADSAARQRAEGLKLPTNLSWRKRQKWGRPVEPKIQ